MPETLAVDYSDADPTPSTIRGHGYVGAGRYIALGTSNKHLEHAEVRALHAAGLGIWVIGEGLANRATAGHAAGVTDARAVLAAANALGVPKACPLFLAVDFDAAPDAVRPYFEGAKTVLGKRLGVYGGIRVTMGLRDLCDWRWQTAAWSGGRLDPQAHIYQRVKMTNPISGCDENVICRPIPLWTGKGAVTFAPPTPAPDPRPVAPSRPGPNVRAAVARLRKALAYANAHHRTKLAAQIRAEIAHLLKIKG